VDTARAVGVIEGLRPTQKLCSLPAKRGKLVANIDLAAILINQNAMLAHINNPLGFVQYDLDAHHNDWNEQTKTFH
jgi:hypothetical protein